MIIASFGLDQFLDFLNVSRHNNTIRLNHSVMPGGEI